MLKLRREQFRILASHMLEKYVARARAHAEEYFPERCAELSEEELRALILESVDEADGYGLQTERDLLRYLTLVLLFGAGFDRDPERPWASRILNGPGSGSFKTSELQTAALIARAQGARTGRAAKAAQEV